MFLASHGYTVVAIPSKGMNTINFEGGSLRDATAQSDDLAFVIDNLSRITNNQTEKIYLSGFSFGGLSHIINTFNSSEIEGIISLDGTIKYQYGKIKKSVYYDLSRFQIPFIHFSQKDISRETLIEQGIDTLINTSFQFYDEIKPPVKYQIKSRKLSHTYFAAYGLLFSEKDSLEDPTYDEIIDSYEELLENFKVSLEYLSSGDLNSDKFTDQIIESNNFEIISYKTYEKPIEFNEFIKLVDGKDLESTRMVYDSLNKANDQFEIAESILNTYGLQNIFDSRTFAKGEVIFKLALSLYPSSGNLYDSLAEGYRYHGYKKLAIENFKKSLKLSPNNQNAKKRLKELE